MTDSRRLRSFSVALSAAAADEVLATPVVDDCRRIHGKLPSAMSTRDSRRVVAVAARDRGLLPTPPVRPE